MDTLKIFGIISSAKPAVIYWFDKYCMVINMQLLRLHRQANKTEMIGNTCHYSLRGLQH